MPARLCERTGGYPNLIQFVCNRLLAELRRSRSLTLTAEHLEAAERSAEVQDYLVWSFGVNTLKAAQVMVYGLLDRPGFT
ncbi:MAG: hypothetical protein GY856_51515, partial [bacterium]|nr:hypothetical protein [bacterium]